MKKNAPKGPLYVAHVRIAFDPSVPEADRDRVTHMLELGGITRCLDRMPELFEGRECRSGTVWTQVPTENVDDVLDAFRGRYPWRHFWFEDA